MANAATKPLQFVHDAASRLGPKTLSQGGEAGFPPVALASHIGCLVKRDERSKKPSSPMPPGRGFSFALDQTRHIGAGRQPAGRSGLPLPPNAPKARPWSRSPPGTSIRCACACRSVERFLQRGSARRAVPAGNQDDRGDLSRTRRSRRWATPTARSTGRRAITASPRSAAFRCAKFSRHDWQDNGEARHVGVELLGPGKGMILENVYVPAGGDVPDRAVNPKFGQKLDFLERMTRWADAARPADADRRRFQHRPARMRRVEPQAAAQGRQPHADRGRDAAAASRTPTAGSISGASTSSRRSAITPGGAIATRTGRRTTAGGGSITCGPRPISRSRQSAHRVHRRRARLGRSRRDHVPLVTEFAL